MLNLIQRIIVVFLVVLGLITLDGCGGDSSVSPENFSIIGTWELTKLEGASGNYSSTWTFKSDNTYAFSLFVEVLGVNENGSGTYNMDGNKLSLGGIVSNLLDTNSLALTLGENQFSFQDDDNDRWTYSKR